MIAAPKQKISSQATSLGTLLAGFRYIWHEKIVLGAISLDLFAVLLGGAVALMPIFALDMLHVGAAGLGLMRAAPGIGAIPTALILARFPIRDHAGRILFIFVGLFGLFTLIFGLRQTIWLSFPMLMLMGACDMVSVSIRETLMQLWTPDEVRGRVNAVNSVFIGASNELGEFRAGSMAAFIGAIAAVAVGGAATMAVSGDLEPIFPGLRGRGGWTGVRPSGRCAGALRQAPRSGTHAPIRDTTDGRVDTAMRFGHGGRSWQGRRLTGAGSSRSRRPGALHQGGDGTISKRRRRPRRTSGADFRPLYYNACKADNAKSTRRPGGVKGLSRISANGLRQALEDRSPDRIVIAVASWRRAARAPVTFKLASGHS